LPAEFPRASEHIARIIELIKSAGEKRICLRYKRRRIFRYAEILKGYGKLGKKQSDKENAAGGDSSKDKARIAINPEKKNPAGFRRLEA